VGRSSLALGVDASFPMVELARRRAAAGGLAHVGFMHADAQTHRFAPLRFDVIVSTRGLDVFAEPVAGFVNLARALRDGGRVAFVSVDNSDGVHAVLERAGFADVARVATGLVTARAAD
jgi:ubiquinone/menaquinone biosynthesis C-methylase UbiE